MASGTVSWQPTYRRALRSDPIPHRILCTVDQESPTDHGIRRKEWEINDVEAGPHVVKLELVDSGRQVLEEVTIPFVALRDKPIRTGDDDPYLYQEEEDLEVATESRKARIP